MVAIWGIACLVGLIAVIDILSRNDKFIRKYYLISPLKFIRLLQLRALIKSSGKLLTEKDTSMKNLDRISQKNLYKLLTRGSALNLRAIKLRDSIDEIFLPLVEQIERDTHNFAELCERALKDK